MFSGAHTQHCQATAWQPDCLGKYWSPQQIQITLLLLNNSLVVESFTMNLDNATWK